MELAELFVSLLLDSSEYTKQISDEVGKAESWGSSLGNNFMKGATVLLAGIGVIITALAGIGLASVNLANDVQNSNFAIQAELGVTAERANELSDVVTNIWGNNFFDSIEEATDALIFVRQTVGDLSDNELQAITEDSKSIADSFDEDFSSIASSAQSLVETGLVDNFDEAFNFITTGFQQGLNRSGDFLDTISEYSTQFADSGATANEFFSILESGLQGGVLGTDKVADLFKEFTLRVADGSDSTALALESLGLSADEVTQGLADGSLDAIDVFNDVIGAISATDDETLAFNSGVALLGTQFEDLGITAVTQLDSISDTFADVEGATDSLAVQYSSFGDLFEGVKRQFLVATLPIGKALLNIANRILPHLINAFNSIITFITPIIEHVGVLIDLFVTDFFGGLESGRGFVTSFIDGLFNAFGGGSDSVTNFILGLETFLTVVKDIFIFIGTNLANFISWKDILIVIAVAITSVLVPAIVSFAVTTITALAPIIAPFLLLLGVVALLRTAWENNFLGIRDILTDVWENTVKPALVELAVWINEVVIPAINNLWDRWVNVIWPNIRDVLIAVWENVVKPILTSLGSFILETLIPVLNTLWDRWVNVIWPNIQTKLSEAWAIIKPILDALWTFFSVDLIPMLEAFKTKWVDEIWPNIQLALENTWIIISEILTEFNRWFEENLIPIITAFRDLWVDEIWPNIETALTTVWEVIEGILISVAEWFDITLPTSLDSGKIKWDEVWNSIKTTIKDVYDNTIKGIFDAIRNFWTWLTSADFSFNFEIPDLPEWMIPNSPIPLHLAWQDFERFTNRADFTPNFNGMNSNMVAPLPATGLVEGNTTTNNSGAINLTLPNVTNPKQVVGSVAEIERIRSSRTNSWVNKR